MASEYCGLRPPQSDFEAFLGKVHESVGGRAFPNMAVREVPKVLEEGTKQRLVQAGVETAGKILLKAIDEVNHGSVDRLDTLVNRELSRQRS